MPQTRAALSPALHFAAPPGTCLLLGGETTADSCPTTAAAATSKPRWQQYAFTMLAATPAAAPLLAAGTDGRDGPTDAAGLRLVDNSWSAAEDRARPPASLPAMPIRSSTPPGTAPYRLLLTGN
jgi:glycerate-2-kinase